MRKLHELILQSIRVIFREITSVFSFSVLSALPLVPVVFLLPLGLALAVLPLVYFPLLAGGFYASDRLRRGERSGFKDMLRGAVRFFLPAVGIGYLFLVFGLILAASWWYYGSKGTGLYFGVAVFQTYFVGAFFISQTYALPLIVQEKETFLRAIGRSVKLAVRHPGYTFGAFLQTVFLAALLALTVVGYACLFAGSLGIYLNAVTANVLGRSEPPQAEEAEEEGWTLTQSPK